MLALSEFLHQMDLDNSVCCSSCFSACYCILHVILSHLLHSTCQIPPSWPFSSLGLLSGDFHFYATKELANKATLLFNFEFFIKFFWGDELSSLHDDLSWASIFQSMFYVCMSYEFFFFGKFDAWSHTTIIRHFLLWGCHCETYETPTISSTTYFCTMSDVPQYSSSWRPLFLPFIGDLMVLSFTFGTLFTKGYYSLLKTGVAYDFLGCSKNP